VPIQIVTGLPGSGKTTYIMEKIESLRAAREPVLFFMCADAAEIGPETSVRLDHAQLSRAGQRCRIDHFIGIAETKQLLSQLEHDKRYTLVFDEAQYYGLGLVDAWIDLSAKGHSIVLSTLAHFQIEALQGVAPQVYELKGQCALMSDGPATQFIYSPDSGISFSVCDACNEVLRQKALRTVIQMLTDQEPYPGEPRIYQPIDLPDPEFSRLAPIREDSARRAEIMAEQIGMHIGPFEFRTRTYLDIGCNTGYFCRRMGDLGFIPKGVDIVSGDIRVAKLLDLYFYKLFMNFICKDAIEFVFNDDNRYDVVSSYSVFQWIYIQSGKQAETINKAIEKLFWQAKHLVFFEMGYSKEEHYQGRLKENIDRDWCLRKMNDSGMFSDIVVYDQSDHNLKRDLFVGVRKQN
jgi:thymidine kinase/SAM-dependent methyltransferase